MSAGAGVVVHLAPHADDECIGAPATLMALRDHGWRVVNVTCSLGRPDEADRRRAEVTEACRRARFESLVLDPPLGDPLSGAEVGPSTRALADRLAPVLVELDPRILVAPSPHDRHRGHEVVGRAALTLGAGLGDGDGDRAVGGRRLWLWGLWADLPLPTAALGFAEDRLDEVLDALAAHAGELDRNDYRRLVRGRAEMNAALGPERVFGFGSAGTSVPFAELLCELGRAGGTWRLGRPRWLDPAMPVGELGDKAVDAWLESPSITDRFGPPGYRDR
ncbi:MAG: PIG-L family deacetylase [Acidobacteriota bacterium]|nr:PIG-L family deacetylase [Acidobacteriota bacterium]